MDEGFQSYRMIRLGRIPKAAIITAVITSAAVITAVIVAATAGLVDMAAFRVPPSGVDQSQGKQIADAKRSTELFSDNSDRIPVRLLTEEEFNKKIFPDKQFPTGTVSNGILDGETDCDLMLGADGYDFGGKIDDLMLRASGYDLSGKNDNLTMRMAGDLDGDGLIEEYLLENNRLTVTENGHIIWQTEEEWSVDSFALDDVTNDGGTKLVISLWKVGSFGAIKPFWHDGEDDSYKNHLFIYKFKEKAFRPVWCSSDLDNPIISFEIKDINGDGLNEVIVKEGVYLSQLGAQSGQDSQTGRASQSSQDSQTGQCLGDLRIADSPQITVWRWDEWGLSRVKGKSLIIVTIHAQPGTGLGRYHPHRL